MVVAVEVLEVVVAAAAGTADADAIAVIVKIRSWGEKKSRRRSLLSAEQNLLGVPSEEVRDQAALRTRARAEEWAGARRHEARA